MKPLNRTSVSFGRHETFALRFGWITKGSRALSHDSGVFDDENSTVKLGVGRNMVHAIRYWLMAAQIVEADGQSLVMTPIGNRIFNVEEGCDPYMEDDATIWLLHWLIASNAKDATTLFWFFNRFHKPEFTQTELFDALRDFIRENTNAKTADNTIKTDIALLLRMYEPSIERKSVPIEEGLDSPMSILGLVNDLGESKYHESKLENRWNLPIAPFCYSVLEVFDEAQLSSLPLSRLMVSEASYAAPGAVFRLSDEGLIAKLEEMIAWLPGYFELRESAGVHQLYKLKNVQRLDVLDKYYSEYQNSQLELVA